MYDADGALLYVGISWSVMVRMSSHQADKPWFSDVARIDVRHYGSRGETLEAEHKAIADEQPRYNLKA